jgi:hypothetical protein
VAFETHLIALTWSAGAYGVASQTTGRIDLGKLKQAGRLADVSQPRSGYADSAAILSREEFAELIGGLSAESLAALWFAALPQEVRFIIVHVAEWES